ncbi:hypothetical protein D9M71_554570 [compost metagenome]
MTRQITAGGEHHRPGHVGHLAPQFGVDEVADAPGAQADRHQRGDEVHQLEEALVVALAEPPDRQNHAEQAAVERHAALPHLEDQRRIGDVFLQVVEQHVAQPPTEHHAAGHPEHQVGEFLLGPARVEALQLARRQQPGPANADQVHQAVPVDLQRPERYGNRVDLGIRQHPLLLATQIRKLRPTQNSSRANRRFSTFGGRRWASRAPTRAKIMLVAAMPTSAGR